MKRLLWLCILSSSLQTHALDRNDLRDYKEKVVATWHTTTQKIKRVTLKVWYWNSIIDDQDYQEHQKAVEEMSYHEKELEETCNALRSSIKEVPDSLYTLIKASIDLIKTRRRNAWKKQRLEAYKKMKQCDEI